VREAPPAVAIGLARTVGLEYWVKRAGCKEKSFFSKNSLAIGSASRFNRGDDMTLKGSPPWSPELHTSRTPALLKNGFLPPTGQKKENDYRWTPRRVCFVRADCYRIV
jgi:hypothetical protein